MSVEDEYWKYGLHDAIITDIQAKEEYTNENSLRFIIDSENALFEYGVKEIIFYNYSASWRGGRIKDFSYYLGCWWIGDKLEKEGNNYILSLELEYPDLNKRENIKITFENLKVVR